MNIESSAVEKLREILLEENDPNTRFRIYVQGGGCSGFQYGFMLDQEKSEDDFVFDYNELQVLIDPMSMQYLQGAEVRWSETDMGSSFVIENPNAATTCGCGSSFSV